MEKDSAIGSGVTPKPRRARGPTKAFPLLAFAKAVQFAREIDQYGVSGQIQRLTLLDKLDISPGSSGTRKLIGNSNRYGLIVGNYNGPSLELTDEAKALMRPNNSAVERRKRGFALAISKFEPFSAVYERLKEKKLPDESVLRDEFVRAGVPADDTSTASEIWVDNLQYLDLVQPIAGSNHVRDLDLIQPQADESSTDPSSDGSEDSGDRSPPPVAPPQGRGINVNAREPSVHIDVQIHIDASATAEQIDQIFASMAKHLYGK